MTRAYGIWSLSSALPLAKALPEALLSTPKEVLQKPFLSTIQPGASGASGQHWLRLCSALM
jgi:hypothetical protein